LLSHPFFDLLTYSTASSRGPSNRLATPSRNFCSSAFDLGPPGINNSSSYQCVLQSDANVGTGYPRFASAPDKSSTKFNSTPRRLASWGARSRHPVCAVGYKYSQSHTRLVLRRCAYCDSMVTAVLDAIGDAILAEDVVSEVFLTVWRHADGFKARAQVST
jgi:hypothetical protein